jgi:hypothetical protein
MAVVDGVRLGPGQRCVDESDAEREARERSAEGEEEGG